MSLQRDSRTYQGVLLLVDRAINYDRPAAPPTDADGFLIPAADLAVDELTELGWGSPDGDPDYGDPADWPAWRDEATWGLGPAIEGEPFTPSEDDLADYAEWSAELGRGFPAEYPPSYVTDEDIVAVQGGAG